MKVRLDILRRESSGSNPFWQSIDYETEDENSTVAAALTDINNSGSYIDTEERAVSHISWECSCLQKKCGACAMLINSYPRLACDSKLKEVQKNGIIRIEPLKKFPVVRDLVVDRSIMMENLKTMKLWFQEYARADETVGDIAYEGSRCLQCGCCLEVCPNFYSGGQFFGTATIVPASRLISAVPESQRKEVFREYRKHGYEGCGKSLACRSVCPAGIDIEDLLVNSNAAAVWKRRKRKLKNGKKD